MDTPLIKLQSVCAGYNNVQILKNISFSVLAGESICILGQNGSGKTTLLKTLAGLLDYSGDIFLNGNNLKRLNRKQIAKKIAVLSQISSIYFSYSVYDTVMLGRYAQNNDGVFFTISKADTVFVEKCLHAVDIWHLRNRQINTLSGGQLQRVYLARTLAQEPDVILLDEPTNHLDIKNQIELIVFLKSLIKNENKSVIGVFHDINLAMQFADKIIFLKDGNIKTFGTKEETATPQIFQEIYGVDVVSWMQKSLEIWK